MGKQEETQDQLPEQHSGHQVDIEGDVSGQLAVGKDITQTQQSIFDQRYQQVGTQYELAGPLIASAAPVVVSLHQLPSPPVDFTGREAELEELRAALEEHRGVAICGLRGLGGIGKTALALKLAEDLTPRYPDAQFFLDLKGTSPEPLTPAEAMAHVVRAYHPTARLPESEGELAGLYRSALHGQRVLLLMDNAADAEQVAPLIPPAGCLLLVTSRRHFTLPGLLARNLDTLSADDARALLLRIAGRIGDYADELAWLCGYMPLALRLAGSALAERPDLSPAGYLRRLADAQPRLGLVEASLDLSYQLLAPEMGRWWRTLAVFPGSFDRLAAGAVWELEPDLAQDSLSELVRYSLVGWDLATNRYRLHNLARLFADARLAEAERALAGRRHAAYYTSVAGAANDLYLQGGEALRRGLALFDLEWGNVQAGQAWAAAHLEEDDIAARLCSTYPDASIHYLTLRQHPREQIDWFKVAVVAAKHLKDRRAEGAHLGNLGNAYYSLGEVERAVEYYHQALAIAREIGDRHDEGAWLGNLGNAYYSLGQVERAVEYYQQALAIDWEIGDRRSEGNHLGNLGSAYRHLGQVEQAVEYYQQAFAIAQAIGDRRAEGAHLGNLGNAYYSLGEVERAVEYYHQALAIAREIGDRHDEGAWLGNLGNAHYSIGQVEQAIEYYEQALAIAREIGDRHGEGSHLGNLGNANYSLGEIDRAVEYHEQALAIAREIGDQRGVGIEMSNLGLVYSTQGEIDQAHRYLTQALATFEEIKSPYALQVRGWLRDTLLRLGQQEEAVSNWEASTGYYEMAYQVLIRLDSKAQAADLAYHIAELFETQGEQLRVARVELAKPVGQSGEEIAHYQNAADWFAQAASLYLALNVLEWYGFATLGQGRCLVKSGAWYRGLHVLQNEALPTLRQVENFTAKADTFFEIGRVHQRLGDYEVARMYYQDALRHYTQLKDEVGSARVKIDMGTLAIQMQELEQAIHLLEEALSILRQADESWQVTRAQKLLTLARTALQRQPSTPTNTEE